MNLKLKILYGNILIIFLTLITFGIIDYNLKLGELHFLVFYLWSLYAFIILIILNLIISIIFYLKKQNTKGLIFIKYGLTVPFVSGIILLIVMYITGSN